MILLILLLAPLVVIPAIVIFILRQDNEEPSYQRYAVPKNLDTIKLVDLPEGITLSSDTSRRREY